MMTNLARRGLLRGRWQQNTIIRPPWSATENQFTENCNRCGDCIAVCETAIITVGSGGFPELNFQYSNCTFCGLCIEACPKPIFKRQAFHRYQSGSKDIADKPWSYEAIIGNNCLTYQGIECRSCQDHCEYGAIRFRAAVGQLAQPILNVDCCSGCGACVISCPVQAILVSKYNNGQK